MLQAIRNHEAYIARMMTVKLRRIAVRLARRLRAAQPS